MERNSRQTLGPISTSTSNIRIPKTQKNMRQLTQRYSNLNQSKIRQKKVTTFYSTDQSSENWIQPVENSNENDCSNSNFPDNISSQLKIPIETSLNEIKFKVKRIQKSQHVSCNSLKQKFKQLMTDQVTTPVSSATALPNPYSKNLDLNKQQITYDMITPEVAAKIVKNYLLPMFERQSKPGSTKDKSNCENSGLESLNLIV